VPTHLTVHASDTLQVQSSSGGPKFTLALLVLVGFCALVGVAWLFFRLFRLCKPQRPQRRLPSATARGGLSAHGRDGRSSASLSGLAFPDLERADTADSLTIVGRTDSMVTRASAWARAILSGEHLPPPTSPSTIPSSPPPSSSSSKTWDTVSIPVKQAIVIMQPDGEATLGISEARQKDVMVQVDEEDLFRESSKNNKNNAGGGSSVPRQQEHQLNSQSRDLVDEAFQCPREYSRENSRSHLGRVSATEVHRDSAGGCNEQELPNNSNIALASSSGTSIANTKVESGVDPTSSDLQASSSTLAVPIGLHEQDQQHRSHHRRRRRRKRRKGTTEASCQTEDSFLN
jgi:hypothetical protein